MPPGEDGKMQGSASEPSLLGRSGRSQGTSQNLKNSYDAAVAVNHNANAPTMTPNRN